MLTVGCVCACVCVCVCVSVSVSVHVSPSFEQLPHLGDLKPIPVPSEEPVVVKKGYMKAVRVIHPDKLGAVSLEKKLTAQNAFAVVNSVYEKFKEAH